MRITINLLLAAAGAALVACVGYAAGRKYRRGVPGPMPDLRQVAAEIGDGKTLRDLVGHKTRSEAIAAAKVMAYMVRDGLAVLEVRGNGTNVEPYFTLTDKGRRLCFGTRIDAE